MLSTYLPAHNGTKKAFNREKLSQKRNIVVCLDSSDQSLEALEWALSFARPDTDSLLLLSAFSDEQQEKVSCQAVLHASQMLKQHEGSKPEWRIFSEQCDNGHISSTIINFAKRNDAHTIVLGSRGLTGVRKLLLGSVAEGVLKGAADTSFAVVVVRSEH